MNSIKAITQLEELRRDRLSFIQITMDVILQKKGEVTNGQQ